MARVTQGVTTRNKDRISYDLRNIFVLENRFITAEFVNGATETTLKRGQLMGRKSATGKVTQLVATATDGSKFPLGILANDIVVAANATVTVNICVSGHVVEDQVILSGAETFDTVIDSKILRDRILSDTLGVYLVKSTENTL